MIRSLYFLIPLLCIGCAARPMIQARSEYVNPSYLASQKIGTPDPLSACFYGQQLVINWHIPERCLPAQIHLQLRYGNRCFQEVVYPVNMPAGIWIYRLLGKEFSEVEGIASYSLAIYAGDTCLGTFKHHLWADLIELPGETASLRKETIVHSPRVT